MCLYNPTQKKRFTKVQEVMQIIGKGNLHIPQYEKNDR